MKNLKILINIICLLLQVISIYKGLGWHDSALFQTLTEVDADLQTVQHLEQEVQQRDQEEESQQEPQQQEAQEEETKLPNISDEEEQRLNQMWDRSNVRLEEASDRAWRSKETLERQDISEAEKQAALQEGIQAWSDLQKEKDLGNRIGNIIYPGTEPFHRD